MFNVLIRAGLLLVALTSSPANADPLCPLGWNCEIAADYRLGKTIYSNGVQAPGCSLHHVARFNADKLEFHMIVGVRTTAPVTEVSLIVGFVAIGEAGKRSAVMLRDLRILSANRVLDTKDWVQSIEREKLRAVSRSDIVTSGPVAQAIIDIASGGIYGALLQTVDGTRLRLEIRGRRMTDKEKLDAKQFRDCAEHGRAPPEEDADRG